MFPIYRPAELALRLSTTVEELNAILHSGGRYYEELLLLDPRKPDKERTVLSVKSPLRQLQGKFYNRILLPSLVASAYSHGGRKGSSIKTNADPHRQSQFVYKTDISDFFPSIHDSRVYRLFHNELGCPPKVAELCSRLCTHRHHLALGLSTSPILADHILSLAVDARIGAACKSAGLAYSRYVDDVTISGPFDLDKDKAGFSSLVTRILSEHGFTAKQSKCEADRNGRVAITGVRIKDGQLDVAKDYAVELDRQLVDAASLANDGPFDGPYYTRGQILGRIQFVSWINRGRERALRSKFRRINWGHTTAHAITRGFIATKKRIVPRRKHADETTLE